jgi:malonyl-CoA O-methyltransferase
MPARQAYDEWAPDYPAEAHNPLMHAEEEAMIARLQGGAALVPQGGAALVPQGGAALVPQGGAALVPQGGAALQRLTCVLDAGAGTGRYTRILRNLGARTVVSLDWSREMLCRQAGDAQRVCGDATRLPFADRAFDLVNASLMAGDIPDLCGWLSEIARVLVPGGRVIYSDFHPAWHERGWRRTFQDRLGRTIALPSHPHGHAAHRDSLAQAGLSLEGIDEVSVAPQLNLLNRWRPAARLPVPALVIVSGVRMTGARP